MAWCYRVRATPDMDRWRTCTTGPIPVPAVEAEAKHFTPAPDAATEYVVKRSARDHSNRIVVEVGERASLETIPARSPGCARRLAVVRCRSLGTACATASHCS